MSIKITDAALNYLKKNNATSVIIDMTLNLTNCTCCGDINSRKYYSPTVAMGFKYTKIDDKYISIEKEGITVFISPRVKNYEEKEIIIGVQKTFYEEKLAVRGIDITYLD